MDLNESLGLLVQEARELLAEMESALLAIEAEGVSDERINSLFRAAHTIKGSAGLFGLETIVSFTHVMESVLVQVRNGEREINADLASLMFECSDHLGSLISALEAQQDLKQHAPKRHKDLLSQLQHALGVKANSVVANAGSAGTASAVRTWKISLQFAPDILQQGMDPLSFIQYLGTLGNIISLNTRSDAVPTLSKLDPEQCYLQFSIELESSADRAKLESVFEFISEGSVIDIRCNDEEKAAANSDISKPIHEITTSARTPVAKAGPEKRTNRDSTIIKLDARKLDQLIDAVGELVIRSASCQTHPDVRRSAGLVELMESVGQLVAQIRDRALDLRMVPIGEVFNRFPRIVRDVSKELGKRIELTISGADTELDKSMVEKLTDPLMHIVRNAIDHGIESIDDRVNAGKPEEGVVRLNAYHQSGAIIIEVSDDGRGLNTDKILRKAIERGLVAADHKLSEREIFNLIFAPGFSTADQVTDLSGRGVGMDVVRQNIEQLRGTVDIFSIAGEGSRFQIQLPLTLAIIDGFQVAVGNAQFVVPLEMVVECIDLPARNAGNRIFNLRGQPLPYVRLADQFALDRSDNARECLVVIACGEQRCGVVVDTLVGELQAVIKPLNNILAGIRGFSGSTILGDGRVALVLDIPALIAMAANGVGQPTDIEPVVAGTPISPPKLHVVANR
jgi:two-component system chemotaxis sensor kinase CheA